MQAILKLIQAFLWAWQYAKENPRKSIAAGVGVGATSAAMLMSSVQYPPPLITAANTTNAPGSNWMTSPIRWQALKATSSAGMVRTGMTLKSPLTR
jgi:hypothetical protein